MQYLPSITGGVVHSKIRPLVIKEWAFSYVTIKLCYKEFNGTVKICLMWHNCNHESLCRKAIIGNQIVQRYAKRLKKFPNWVRPTKTQSKSPILSQLVSRRIATCTTLISETRKEQINFSANTLPEKKVIMLIRFCLYLFLQYTFKLKSAKTIFDPILITLFSILLKCF